MNLNDITLTAEIPLDANLDNRTTIGYDSDGDPIYPSGPVTVVDAVIAAAAESLAAGLMREFSNLEQALTKLLDRELTKALDDTMADARRKALDAVAGVAQDKLAEALRQSISQIAKG